METGIFLNGKFIECDINNLEILVKGNVQNLNIGTSSNNSLKTSHTTMNIGQQFFYGKISGGTFGTIINHNSENVDQIIEEIPPIKIIVENDVVNLNASIGDVHCKNTNSVNTTSGGVNVIGNVSGSVKSMSGAIHVEGNVGGSVSSMSGTVFTKSR